MSACPEKKELIKMTSPFLCYYAAIVIGRTNSMAPSSSNRIGDFGPLNFRVISSECMERTASSRNFPLSPMRSDFPSVLEEIRFSVFPIGDLLLEILRNPFSVSRIVQSESIFVTESAPNKSLLLTVTDVEMLLFAPSRTFVILK